METRITCELKDVNAIEFECTECHAKTAVPVDHFKNPPTRCTLCEAGGQWLMAGGQEWNDLVGLSKALQRLSDTGTGKKGKAPSVSPLRRLMFHPRVKRNGDISLEMDVLAVLACK